jgi:hypothetical protein
MLFLGFMKDRGMGFRAEWDVMKNMVYMSFVVVALSAFLSVGAPEPAVVQGPGQWTVDVVFEHPHEIMPRSGGDRKPKRFWYTILTLTNETNGDVDFYPKCELMTDTFEITPAGKGVPTAVFEHIKRRHQGSHPFLESLEETSHKILQGRDNTRDIAIIWPDFAPKAKNIRLYIAGLSNETVVIDHPVARDEAGEPVKVYLRKTLELSYGVSGDAALRSEADLSYNGRRWVMR